MKIKRYFAPDARQAMRMVRDSQGPDAVILSNKRVDGGIEIVAAIDYDESKLPHTLPTTSSASNTDNQPDLNHLINQSESTLSHPKLGIKTTAAQMQMSAAARYEGDFTDSTKKEARQESPPRFTNIQWGQEPAIVEMQTELKNLRGMLEKQLSGLAWDDFTRRYPHKADLIQQLMALGLSDLLCKSLAEKLPEQTRPDDLFKNSLECLSNMIPVANDEILNEGGIVALVGPTGVGKTTTAAKLAARYALRHGNRHVALVTIDNYRVCAHEQLRTYGRILDIPVKTADSRQELRRVLDDLCDRRLVLIDTAGMSQRDSHLSEQASILCGDDMFIKSSLVLSATSQVASMQEVMQAFGVFNPVSLIMTKLDEATSLGGVLDITTQYGMPVSYVCDGQQVPEDLHLARAYDLVNRCVDIVNRTIISNDNKYGMGLTTQPMAKGAINANV